MTRILAVLVAATLALAVSLSTAADTVVGKVISIADGDTLTVLVDRRQVKVRLEGIDTPEKGQPFGSKAKEALGKLVFGKTAAIRSIGQDKYKRTLGRVFVRVDDKTVDVNHALVAQGFAWHYKKYSDDKTLAKAEQHAREKHRGLWADDDPIPPWDWRKGARTYRHAEDEPATGYWLNSPAMSGTTVVVSTSATQNVGACAGRMRARRVGCVVGESHNGTN